MVKPLWKRRSSRTLGFLVRTLFAMIRATRFLVRAFAIGGPLLALLTSLGGCWTYTPAPPHVLGGAIATVPVIPAEAWRPRDIDVLKPLMDATPAEVHRYEVREGVDPASLSPSEREEVARVSDRVVYKGIHGMGLVRVFETDIKGIRPPNTSGYYQPIVEQDARKQPQDRLEDYLQQQIYGFVGNARVITSRTIQNPLLRETLLNDRAARERARVASPDSKVVESGIASETLLYAGVPVRLPPMRAPGARAYRGLILHLHAIRGNEYEPKVMEELERRGWAIVDFQTQTQIDPPLTPDEKARETLLLAELARSQQDAIDSLRAAGAAHRSIGDATLRNMRASAAAETPAAKALRELRRKASFQACEGADLDPIAASIATEVDQAMSGASYAVEAILDYIRTQRPDLPTHPMVLMGFSAGALGTPTVDARLNHEPDALVIIGGGANIFMLSQESSLTDGGIRVRCGEKKVDRATRDELSRLYLLHSRLDPYHTAPLLAGRPILQVHASKDTWVPASGGELLFQQMQRAADRLVINADHDLLFYFLPDQALRIADWVDRAVAGESATHEAARSESRDAQKRSGRPAFPSAPESKSMISKQTAH